MVIFLLSLAQGGTSDVRSSFVEIYAVIVLKMVLKLVTNSRWLSTGNMEFFLRSLLDSEKKSSMEWIFS